MVDDRGTFEPTESREDAERLFIEDFDTWDMTGYYLYSKLLRSGVSRHIGTGVGEFRHIVERGRFGWPPDRFTVSDQARREARENFGIDRLLKSAFLEVIIVVETDAEDFRRLGHRRQFSNCVQVDCAHGQMISACAQQICTLCDQFGQSAWKAALARS